MNEAQIRVEFINQPDKNPGFGSVRAERIDQTQSEKYWDVPANMLSQFEKGGTYTVGFTMKQGTKRTFYQIKELRSSAAPPAPAPSPAIGHNNPPNVNGSDKDRMISALALYNHSFPRYAALLEKEIDYIVMGKFFLQCRLAIDWTDKEYKKFWAEKNAPKQAPAPKPQQVVDDIGDTWAP